MPDLQIAMRDPKVDRIRATRRFGAFAVLTLCAIEKIRAGTMTAAEAARHFEQVARTHRLRATGIPSWWTCSSRGCGRPGKRSAVRGGKAINRYAAVAEKPVHARSGQDPTSRNPKPKRSPATMLGNPCRLYLPGIKPALGDEVCLHRAGRLIKLYACNHWNVPATRGPLLTVAYTLIVMPKQLTCKK
jgi:hypothetical protein